MALLCERPHTDPAHHMEIWDLFIDVYALLE